MLSESSHLFVLGVGFGLLVALAGAFVDYRLHIKRTESADRARVPLLLIIGGFMGLLGVLAIVVSLVVADSIRPAIATGIGVGIGFNAGFFVVLVIWLIRERLRRRPTASTRS